MQQQALAHKKSKQYTQATLAIGFLIGIITFISVMLSRRSNAAANEVLAQQMSLPRNLSQTLFPLKESFRWTGTECSDHNKPPMPSNFLGGVVEACLTDNRTNGFEFRTPQSTSGVCGLRPISFEEIRHEWWWWDNYLAIQKACINWCTATLSNWTYEETPIQAFREHGTCYYPTPFTREIKWTSEDYAIVDGNFTKNPCMQHIEQHTCHTLKHYIHKEAAEKAFIPMAVIWLTVFIIYQYRTRDLQRQVIANSPTIMLKIGGLNGYQDIDDESPSALKSNELWKIASTHTENFDRNNTAIQLPEGTRHSPDLDLYLLPSSPDTPKQRRVAIIILFETKPQITIQVPATNPAYEDEGSDSENENETAIMIP